MAQNCWRLLFALSWALASAKVHIKRSGVLPVSREDIAIQFFITIASDLQRVVVTPKKPRCCWMVAKHDIDCKSMELVGWNKVEVRPSRARNISYIFPNIYPLDRVGKCHFLLKVGRRQLSHSIAFNTTENRHTSWKDIFGFGDRVAYRPCSSVDLNPFNKCKPVNCVHKYNGHRSFFNKQRKRCEKVQDCYTKTTKDDLPEIAYDKDFNTCKSLVAESLTPEQERWLKQKSDESELAKERFELEKADDINPSPLNCHHGRRVGSVCVCDEGWKTDITKAKFGDKKFIVHWCNEEIRHSEKLGYKIQRSLFLSGLSLIATALLIGWLSMIWFSYIGKEEYFLKKFKSLVANKAGKARRRDDSQCKGIYAVVKTDTFLTTADSQVPLTKKNRITDITRITARNDTLCEGSWKDKRGTFHPEDVQFHNADGSNADFSTITLSSLK